MVVWEGGDGALDGGAGRAKVELVRDGQVWDVFGKELPSESESGCGTRRKQDCSDF